MAQRAVKQQDKMVKDRDHDDITKKRNKNNADNKLTYPLQESNADFTV